MSEPSETAAKLPERTPADTGHRGAEVRESAESLTSRQRLARIGVVACVGLASLVAAGRLDDTIAVFDDLADRNATASYVERTYPESHWVAGSPDVLEDARLWIPEDSSYRVVHGPLFSTAESSGYGRYFLLGLLLPRQQTDDTSAEWVFCYGCKPSTLGPEFEVLSDSGDGFLFGRMVQ